MKLDLELIKSFKTSIGTYKKVLVTTHHTYYVNEKECDENGNTFMFRNDDGMLVSSNHFASSNFSDSIMGSEIEFMSKNCYKNLKLMLENDYELISDCANLSDDPLNRDEESFNVYLCHDEMNFIAIGHEDDYIIRYKVKGDIDKAKELIKEWSFKNYQDEPQNRDVFFEGSQIELLQVLKLK